MRLPVFYLDFFMSIITDQSRKQYLLLLIFYDGKMDWRAAPELPGAGEDGTQSSPSLSPAHAG